MATRRGIDFGAVTWRPLGSVALQRSTRVLTPLIPLDPALTLNPAAIRASVRSRLINVMRE